MYVPSGNSTTEEGAHSCGESAFETQSPKPEGSSKQKKSAVLQADRHWFRPQRYGPLDAEVHAAIDPMSYRQLYSPVLWRRILGERTMNQSPLPRVPL